MLQFRYFCFYVIKISNDVTEPNREVTFHAVPV
jgi:hypothetical protein